MTHVRYDLHVYRALKMKHNPLLPSTCCTIVACHEEIVYLPSIFLLCGTDYEYSTVSCSFFFYILQVRTPESSICRIVIVGHMYAQQ